MESKLTFVPTRDTKNTVVFTEEAAEGEETIGTLYVQKTAKEISAAKKLEVTLKAI